MRTFRLGTLKVMVSSGDATGGAGRTGASSSSGGGDFSRGAAAPPPCLLKIEWRMDTRLSRCFSRGGVKASSQCWVLIKYSKVLDGKISSMRKGTTVTPLLTDRSISRLICGEALELAEKIKIMTLLCSMASIMAVSYTHL